MTGDWSDTTDPAVLLDLLRESGPFTVRKLRLWGCACVRRAWHLLDPVSRAAVEAIERYVDGKSTWREAFDAGVAAAKTWEALCEVGGAGAAALSAAEAAATVAYGYEQQPVEPYVAKAAESTADALTYAALRPSPAAYDDALEAERAVQCQLLRCICGSPFHPLRIDAAWLTSTVVRIAKTIYAERRWGEMGVLGDSLEEVGCRDEEVLSHCRGPGPHTRGCWLVDLVLGNS